MLGAARGLIAGHIRPGIDKERLKDQYLPAVMFSTCNHGSVPSLLRDLYLNLIVSSWLCQYKYGIYVGQVQLR